MIIPGTGHAASSLDLNVFKSDTFYQGVLNMKTLDVDPYISGYAFIYWIKIPTWVANLAGGEQIFRGLTEKNLKSFGGINDMELTTGTITHGFNAQEYNVATGFSKSNTDFNLKYQEFSGGPIRNIFTQWVMVS